MLRMPSLRTKAHVAGAIRFLGEQDGVPEREFKERVIQLLHANGAVKRGYLARVAYEKVQSPVVALCLLPRKVQLELLREIGTVFASMFGQNEHLDMFFIDRHQEKVLARVCRPFFESET